MAVSLVLGDTLECDLKSTRREQELVLSRRAVCAVDLRIIEVRAVAPSALTGARLVWRERAGTAQCGERYTTLRMPSEARRGCAGATFRPRQRLPVRPAIARRVVVQEVAPLRLGRVLVVIANIDYFDVRRSRL